MFWSSVYTDLKIIIFLLFLAFLLSTFIYFKNKKLLSLFVFSALVNIVLYYGMDFHFAQFFNIMYFFVFVRNIWPIINIVLFISLIILYFKNKNEKKKK